MSGCAPSGRDDARAEETGQAIWDCPTKGLARERTLLLARALLASDRYVYGRPEDGPEREWTILEACQLVRRIEPGALSSLWRDYSAGGGRRTCAVALMKHFKRSWGRLPECSAMIVDALRTIPDDLKADGDARHQLAVVGWVERALVLVPAHAADAVTRRMLYRAAHAMWDIRFTRAGTSHQMYGAQLLSKPAFTEFIIKEADRAQRLAGLVVERGCTDPEELEALLHSEAPAALLAGAL